MRPRFLDKMQRLNAVSAWAIRMACALVVLTDAADVRAQDGPPVLRTNENEVVEAMKVTNLAIDDPLAVFAFVLNSLPDRVQVYPTENYYYFRFLYRGVPYDGNIRLAASDRDKGVVNFAYGESPTEWNENPTGRHAALGTAEGVTVERLAPLLYRVSFGSNPTSKPVTFALNDLSQVKPPQGLLAADEQYIGPIFDESGVRFFLVFNAKAKVFHYLLDETATLADELFASGPDERILIGKRTGFAFYRDRNRKLLVGVSAHQSLLNTAFDGPFDQLPENFIQGDTLRDAIVAADPRVKGKIDRLGNFADGSSRYLIHPYLPYWDTKDLAVFHRCAQSKSVPASERPRCFVIDDAETGRPNPRPLALKRR